MIACDDRFLNDESMLKTMLRIFEKWIVRTFRLKSISWVVSSFSLRREARDVCVCVLCSRKMRIRSVVCEKDFYFVEFKDFCLLRSILELIVRSLVNIKRREESLLRWRDSNIFYSTLFLKHFSIQSYFNFSCYFSSWNSLKFMSCFVKMIAFNFFSSESYYAYESTLIIEACKKMILIAKYMIQREFANYMIKRQLVINERLKQVWSWIKQDRIWEKYHQKFREFENDYSEIVSLIRQTQDVVKLKQEVVNTILIKWELNVNRDFNFFSLHTMRAIRKCAIRYSFAKALKMTKRVVLHRLSRTKQKIFRSLLFNAANWFKVAQNLYERKSIDDEILEKYKIDDSESFFRRENEFIKFTQFTNRQSRYLYRVLELKLKDLFTSNFTSKKSDAKQLNVIIDDQNTTIDKNAIIDKDAIIDKNITIDKNIMIDKDDIIDKNIITNKNAIDKDVVIESENIIDKKVITSKDIIEKNAIEKIDTNRAKHCERDQTNNCDCRELDEFWKNDLQRHDRDVHENQNALFLFSSINYIIWVICNMHHTILKNVFELRNHSIRRVLIDRMNRIWRRRWNIANVRRKHFNWFNWRYVRRIWSVVFLSVTSFSFCRSHSIILTTASIKCDVKTKKKLFFSKEKFFFCLFLIFDRTVLRS